MDAIEANDLCDRAIEALEDSGNSASVSLADHLRTVASNGGEMETPEAMHEEARAMIEAAQTFLAESGAEKEPLALIQPEELSDGSTVHDVKLSAQVVHCRDAAQALALYDLVTNPLQAPANGGAFVSALIDKTKDLRELLRVIVAAVDSGSLLLNSGNWNREAVAAIDGARKELRAWQEIRQGR